jgi:Protein of unknown function (DUF4238)
MSAPISGEMTLQDPIKNHHTPVFHLKAWARDGRVVRYFRPHNEVKAAAISPKNTGFEDNLYAFQGVSPEHTQLLEREFFAPVDSRAAVVHRLLVDGKLRSLTNAQRVDWARFMLSTQLRNPFALEEVKRLTLQTMLANMGTRSDPEYEEVRKEDDPETMYEWIAKHHPEVIENAHKQFLPGLIDHEDLGSYLINMHWAVIDLSGAAHRLLTGDRPFIATHGWKEPQAVLMIALSPDRLFTATNSVLRTEQIISASPSRLVGTVNDLIVRQAVEFVIGDDESQLQFVERRLRRRGEEPIPGPVGRGRPGCPA